MTGAPGVYIHVPFCAAKCPYCDFYSLPVNADAMDAYRDALCACMDAVAPLWPHGKQADTLYLGGGTPGLLGAVRLAKLIGRARERFGLFDAEITVELNPGAEYEAASAGELGTLLRGLHLAGANRLSLGLQSAVPEELAALGRRHTAQDAAHAVELARAAGFWNISLDLMLGLPGQTEQSVERSVRFCADLGVEHISAYLLKIEPGTPFANGGVGTRCPDDDVQAALYLHAVRLLEQCGYHQYEISNFARPGRESRHNLKYWDCREYLGLGPAAHSLTNGVRWYWPRNLQGFLQDWHGIVLEEGDVPARLSGQPGALPFPEDAPAVPPEEYAMLRLRLADGLRRGELLARYPQAAPLWDAMLCRAAPLRKTGLLQAGEGALALTPEGFLLSNAVTLRLLG